MKSVVILSVIMLRVIMLSVIMLSAIIQSVVAPNEIRLLKTEVGLVFLVTYGRNWRYPLILYFLMSFINN